jgi:hypothetical protein
MPRKPTGQPNGAPAKYRTSKDFWKVAEAYLVASKGSLTINGLVQALGFCDRVSLLDYKNKGQFANTVKRAISVIEQEVEHKLLTAAHKNPSGLIFWLKNHKWSDQVQVEHSGTVDNIVRFPLKAPVGAPIDSLESKKAPGTI